MPSLAASRLTEAHRLAQQRIGVQTVQDMLNAWSLIDVKALDSTVPTWLRVTIPLIQNRRTASAVLAGDYLRAFRLLELGSRFTPILMGPLDTAAATTSLTVTGPVSLKSAMATGTELARAAEIAQSNTARAAMRHALGGGRDTITATTEADERALGYIRVTSGSACDFCRMLAGRRRADGIGGVYSAETANFNAHDGCSCSAEPVYEAN